MKARSLAALVVLGLAVGAGTCEGTNPASPSTTYEVTLINNDDTAVHLFAPGEDFPAGRVEPELARMTTVTIARGAGAFFRAGRNEEILATVRCGPVTGNDGTGVVLWAGAGVLTCAGGFSVL